MKIAQCMKVKFFFASKKFLKGYKMTIFEQVIISGIKIMQQFGY